MSTVYFFKNWSEKPTYGEVVAFSSQSSLIDFLKRSESFDSAFSWGIVERTVELHGEIITKWWDTLSSLHMEYRYLNRCPDCIQDWFNHLYDLTLLLKED
jgi:hypothetical protein